MDGVKEIRNRPPPSLIPLAVGLHAGPHSRLDGPPARPLAPDAGSHGRRFLGEKSVYAALFFFVLYFIADVLQALCGALLHKRLAERTEHELRVANRPGDSEIDKPRWLDWPAFGFFLAKCALLTTAFVFVAIYLALVWVRANL